MHSNSKQAIVFDSATSNWVETTLQSLPLFTVDASYMMYPLYSLYFWLNAAVATSPVPMHYTIGAQLLSDTHC